MDSCGFVDSIQVEKANALARYRRFNNISKLLRLIEVFLAVGLISWSSTRLPTVFKVIGEYLYACSCYVLNQHVVFLVGNVIVVLCYALSGHNEVGNGSASSDNSEHESHDRYRSGDPNTELVTVTVTVSSPVEELPEMKPVATAEIDDAVVRNETTDLKIESKLAVQTEINQAAKQLEKFKRTQSAKLRREMSVKPRKELRRSVTERRSSAVTTGDGDISPSSLATVERLSNEEFRRVVEAFISKRQSLLKQG